MKYTLKNRPHLQWEKTLQEIGYSAVSETEKWFEGFEKELQENTFEVEIWVQETPVKPIPNFKGATESKGHFEKRKAILLNEILGVSEEAKNE